MIGRVVYSLLLIAAIAAPPVSAAAPSITSAVLWEHNGTITWDRLAHRAIAPATIHRWIPGLALGRTRIIAHGHPGTLEIAYRFSQRDGGPVHRHTLWAKLLRKSAPRIVGEGIGNAPLADFEMRGLDAMAYLAHGAMEMIATAYTAGSAGGSGFTALGRRAGHGIVAVDPRIIPLGTRLYIPGYGLAIAGDTGGDIVGRRIDLGFDSLRGAMMFGRRDITVYRLK